MQGDLGPLPRLGRRRRPRHGVRRAHARLHGDRLHNWIARVEADRLPELHSFTAGLNRDLDAVVNGLSLPYSSGAVEGNVNRIKMLKRQMYGRASFDLLRKRVLLTA
jgi:transposase